MNTKLKTYLKLFLFSIILIFSSATYADDPPPGNQDKCSCCGEEVEEPGKCGYCEENCPCPCPGCGGCFGNCNCASTGHNLCGFCMSCCPCKECKCCGRRYPTANCTICSGSLCKDGCGKCNTHCACNKCVCCKALVNGSGDRCSACNTICECGGCTTHSCTCGLPPNPGGNEGDGGSHGSDFDAWINMKIYDNDGNWIPFERDHPNYNETSPGAFVMQTFEENGIIDESKMNKLYFDGDIGWADETDEQIKIERINDKIKLWKAERLYRDENGVWIYGEKRHKDIFGSSNSKTFSAEEFFNDIQYKQFWVEGVEPGVSGIKTYSANEFDDEVKITVCGGTDLTIHNGGSDLDNGELPGSQGSSVSDSDEENVGAYLLVNWDDDDADGILTTENGWANDPIPDLQEHYVQNEDNLAKLVLNISALPPNGSYELEVVSSANKIKLWVSANKGIEINLSGNSISWDLTSTYDRSDLQYYINNGLWIEGIEASDSERDIEIVFRYYDSGGIERLSDTIKATVVMLDLGAGVCRAMAISTLKPRGHAGLLTKFNGSCKPTDFRNSSLYTVHEMQSSDDCCVTPTWKTFHDQATYWDEYGYDLTHIQRLKILQTAKWVENEGSGDEKIKYTMSKVLKPEVWSGSLATLKNLRCDGLVEFCYEWNEIDLFGKKTTPSTSPHYSIVDSTEEHNKGTMNLYFFWQPHLYPATQCGHENTYRGNEWETMFNPIEISNPGFGNIIW